MPTRKKKFYGNKETKVLHNATSNNDRCRSGALRQENRVTFNDLETPREQGYVTCKHCFGKGGYASASGE